MLIDMHRIGQITASIKVDDPALGYELNELLIDLFDSDLDGELEALLDKFSTDNLIKLFEQVQINIELHENENHYSKIKNETLRQLREILLKNTNNFEFNNEYLRNDAHYDTHQPPDVGMAISEEFLIQQYLTQYFRIGTSPELSRWGQDELRKIVRKLLDEHSYQFLDKISSLIKQEPGAALRIANFFSITEIKSFTDEIAKRYSFSISMIDDLNSLLLQLIGTNAELEAKLISLSIMVHLNAVTEKQLRSEMETLKKQITDFQQDEIGIMKSFESVILQEIIFFQPQSFIGSVLKDSGRDFRILTQQFPQRDHNLKIDDSFITKSRTEYRDTGGSEWGHDIRHYLFSTFEFIVLNGSFPFWLRDEDIQKIFFQLVRNILDSNVTEFKDEIKKLLLKQQNSKKIYSNIISSFTPEIRISLANILSEGLADTLHLFRHFFLSFKKRTIEEAHPFTTPVKDFFSSDFSTQKISIIDFLISVFLVGKTYRTIKDLFSVFLITQLNVKATDQTNTFDDLEYLFGQGFKVPEGSIEIEDLISHKPDDKEEVSSSNRIIRGMDLVSDLKTFGDFIAIASESKVVINADEYIDWMVDVASIDSYNIPDEIRLFVLHNGMKEAEKHKLATAEFLHLILSGNNWIFNKEIEIEDEKHFSELITVMLREIREDISHLKVFGAGIAISPAQFSDFFRQAEVNSGIKLTGIKTLMEYLANSEAFLYSFENSGIDYKSLFAQILYSEQLSPHPFTDKSGREVRALLSKIIRFNMDLRQLVLLSERKHQQVKDIIQKFEAFIILEERLIVEKGLKEYTELREDVFKSFDDAMFLQLQSKYKELIAKIGPTDLIRRINTELSVGELLKLSDTFVSATDIEFNLRRYVIYIGEKYNVPLHYVAISLLDKLLNLGTSQFMFPQYKEVLYMMGYHLYDLTLKIINTPKFKSEDKEQETVIKMSEWNIEPDESISIRVSNAGLVICNPFIILLFQRLDLLNPEKKFKDNECINKAIIVLNYLSYGDIDIKEFNLGLNNVLCNVPKDFYYDFSVKLTVEEKELCNSLLENICNQWTALKNTSPDGLRHNFFIREGSLSYDGTSYKLVVAEKVYDVLISKIPWTIGTIKFPWMENFLFTDWKY